MTFNYPNLARFRVQFVSLRYYTYFSLAQTQGKHKRKYHYISRLFFTLTYVTLANKDMSSETISGGELVLPGETRVLQVFHLAWQLKYLPLLLP